MADPYSQATTEERLRILRHDALQQHLYETAAYFGEKVMAMTGMLRRCSMGTTVS